jgi:hypothetical protein
MAVKLPSAKQAVTGGTAALVMAGITTLGTMYFDAEKEALAAMERVEVIKAAALEKAQEAGRLETQRQDLKASRERTEKRLDACLARLAGSPT